MKIAIVYGTRPEIIKLTPLILRLKENDSIELTLINTGQHKEMVSEIETLFGLRPHFSLEVMQHNQTLTDILRNVAFRVEGVLKELSPNLVLLQGDTSTVASVGMVCFYNKIPVGHVEAGLRSYNLEEPYPEEFNRRVISIMAELNFAPTLKAADNLMREGVPADKIAVTGNTIVDMVQLARKRINLDNKMIVRKILITAHRRENHGVGIKNICEAIKAMNKKFPDLRFVWPVHPNPNVQETVYNELDGLDNVQLTEPLGYIELMRELEESYLIWSDSGGIQEECPSFGKPVLILRNVTERPEVVTSGFGKLVGTDVGRIIELSSRLLTDKDEYRRMTLGTNPFGDGTASDKIVEAILKKVKVGK
jgi:UDP-N-acetylglucosamine 2-epimerase (non-hydrolysing)